MRLPAEPFRIKVVEPLCHFQAAVRDSFGYRHVIPTHPGRVASGRWRDEASRWTMPACPS